MAVQREQINQRKAEIPKTLIEQIKQLDLPAMSLQSLLQFGTGLLPKEAIAAEITQLSWKRT